MNIPRLSKTETEVLRLLIGRGEMYGLELVKSSDLLKRGTVYVLLGRMAEKGYVESRQEAVAAGDGPPKRMYKATGLGVRAYKAMDAARAVFDGDISWAI